MIMHVGSSRPEPYHIVEWTDRIIRIWPKSISWSLTEDTLLFNSVKMDRWNVKIDVM